METINKILIFMEFIVIIKKAVEPVINMFELSKKMNYSGKEPTKNMKKFLKSKGLLKYLDNKKLELDSSKLLIQISEALGGEFPKEKEKLIFKSYDSLVQYMSDLKKEKRKKKELIVATIQKYLEDIEGEGL